MKSLISLLSLFLISCSGCALIQLDQMMLNHKRKSIGIIVTNTFLRVTSKTSTSASITIETSTQTLKKKDIITSFRSSGSASIVEHKNKFSFILTAAHVCTIAYEEQIKRIFPFYNEKEHDVMWSRTNKVYDIEGTDHIAVPLIWSPEYDVCIMVTNKINQPSLSLSWKPPFPGEKIYYMGFPRGIGGGSFIPMFTGRYIGHKQLGSWNKHQKIAGFTLPIAPGSSGSSVLDVNGNIIGMLHSYYPQFDNIGFSATHSQLKELFEKADEVWEIRKSEIARKLRQN